MIQYKKYYMPGTKEELLKTIDTIDCTYDILAGGTDLYAKEKTPFNGADAAIDISGIKEFSVIKLKKEEGLITFGSNICIQQREWEWHTYLRPVYLRQGLHAGGCLRCATDPGAAYEGGEAGK